MFPRPSRYCALATCWLALACAPAPAPAPSPAPRTIPAPTKAYPLATNWSNCGFPAQSKSQFGWVRLHVYVDAQGAVQHVEILQESEPAFGDHAGQCAYRAPFKPATDASGKPIGAWTPEFTVRFVL